MARTCTPEDSSHRFLFLVLIFLVKFWVIFFIGKTVNSSFLKTIADHVRLRPFVHMLKCQVDFCNRWIYLPSVRHVRRMAQVFVDSVGNVCSVLF